MRRLLERTASVLDEFVSNPGKTLKEIDILFAAEREAISYSATTAASRVPKIRIEEDITDFASRTAPPSPSKAQTRAPR